MIIISIASKHIALPIDHLLTDLRYGDGTNIDTLEEAENIAQGLKNVLSQSMNCSSIFRENTEPTGSGLGPIIEMIESLAVLKNDNLNLFD